LTSAQYVRVGIGGWSYEPWRGTFYPHGMRQKDELAHAGRVLTAMEINATFHRLQKPSSFAAWAAAVPDGFVFALKAGRYAVTRPNLAEAGEAVVRFMAQGLTELGPKLGPILWQLPATKRFDPDEIRAFLDLLPAHQDGLALRHAVQARHESFRDPAFEELMRQAGAATVLAQSTSYPQLAADTAGFVYARLEDAREEEPLGYSQAELDRLALRARGWAAGRPVDGEALDGAGAERPMRDVFLFVINGAKVRAPAAALALLERLRD
jgi:uncharacterized protein YecE (DUF72 family)